MDQSRLKGRGPTRSERQDEKWIESVRIGLNVIS